MSVEDAGCSDHCPGDEPNESGYPNTEHVHDGGFRGYGQSPGANGPGRISYVFTSHIYGGPQVSPGNDTWVAGKWMESRGANGPDKS